MAKEVEGLDLAEPSAHPIPLYIKHALSSNTACAACRKDGEGDEDADVKKLRGALASQSAVYLPINLHTEGSYS